MTTREHCNALRMQIWDLEDQRTQLMLMAPEVRNESKILQLAAEIDRLEAEIKRVREA
ncbi:hypothetical protein GCM10011348_45920 [Marinobacterium nitratireducens]|uniref:Uncharacterized protein n=1 Tax=Marinobacterium nitratireducens TaxID=518897 RepID=A0A917ZPS5_9GAMM|nr:hypothetical protein [Marinobacterium nitratireducens]GGO89058.1 hypothetical protein GCM10011348_45920 [Marinobacterium nitratireducens]